MSKYWPPKSRSRESIGEGLENEPDSGSTAEDGPSPGQAQADGPPDEAGEEVETQDDEEGLGEDGYMDGETTPPTSTKNEDEDELLAWTLGGSLKMTPGSPWANYVPSPAKNAEVPDPNSDAWITQRLEELATLSLHLA